MDMPSGMMKFCAISCASLMAVQSLPAMAQGGSAATPVIAAVEPGAAELVAASKLIDIIMPPAQRKAMTDTMIQSMLQNMTSGIVQSSQLQKAFKEYPAMQDIFKKFIEREEAKAVEMMQDNMPSMIDAMSRAYARRFSVAELIDLNEFFSSPTGQTYIAQSVTIMSDPDVARWQSDVMQKSMEDMPAAMEQLMIELMAVKREAAAE